MLNSPDDQILPHLNKIFLNAPRRQRKSPQRSRACNLAKKVQFWYPRNNWKPEPELGLDSLVSTTCKGKQLTKELKNQ